MTTDTIFAYLNISTYIISIQCTVRVEFGVGDIFHWPVFKVINFLSWTKAFNTFTFTFIYLGGTICSYELCSAWCIRTDQVARGQDNK